MNAEATETSTAVAIATPAPVSSLAAELDVLVQVATAIEPLTPLARRRVLCYVIQRFLADVE